MALDITGADMKQMTHMKGAAEKTTLTSQYSTSICPVLNWDAALHENDACYAPKRLLHDQEEQEQPTSHIKTEEKRGHVIILPPVMTQATKPSKAQFSE